MGRHPDVRAYRVDPVTEPGDGTRLLLTVLFAAWAMAFAVAFYAAAVASDLEARTVSFLGWQGVAGTLAIAVFGVSRNWPAGNAVRRLGLVPLAFAAFLAATIVAVVFWARVV